MFYYFDNKIYCLLNAGLEASCLTKLSASSSRLEAILQSAGFPGCSPRARSLSSLQNLVRWRVPQSHRIVTIVCPGPSSRATCTHHP
eukprot:390866-Prorocentrum_minimum.AAC.4